MKDRKVRTDWATWILRVAHAGGASWCGWLTDTHHKAAGWLAVALLGAMFLATFWPVRKDRL